MQAHIDRAPVAQFIRAFIYRCCEVLSLANKYNPTATSMHSFMNVKKDGHMMSVLEKLRACFSPLVFAATGGMGPTATTVFRKFASMLTEKCSINYSKCLFWLRCRLCFSLLRFAVMCLSGHRSSVGHPSTTNIDLAYSEGCLESGGLV